MNKEGHPVASAPHVVALSAASCPVDSASEDLRALEHVMRGVARRLQGIRWVEGFCWYGLGLAALLVGVVLIGLGGFGAQGVLSQVFQVGLAVVTLFALALWGLWLFRWPDADTSARCLERAPQRFRGDLLSALHFARELVEEEETTYSRSLATAHVRQTLDTLREAERSGALKSALPTVEVFPPMTAGLGCLMIVCGCWLWAPDRVSVLFEALWSLDEASPVDFPTSSAIVGEIHITYDFPSYTKMPQRVEAFSNGRIEALTGTEIEVRVTPLLSAEKMQMVLAEEGVERLVNMKRTPDGAMRARFVVTRDGRYRFRLERSDGQVETEADARSIVALVDQPPSVQILDGKTQYDVRPDEVITLHYEVRDEFGLATLSRVHNLMSSSEETREPVELDDDVEGAKSLRGSLNFDLAPLALEPKDLLMFRLEATDTNVATGPGVGRSDPIVFRVTSLEDRHMATLEQEEAMSEALLGLLADFLESPVGARSPKQDGVFVQRVPTDLVKSARSERIFAANRVHGHSTRTLAEMSETLAGFADDPLLQPRDLAMFRSIHRDLIAVHDRGDTRLKLVLIPAQQETLTTGNVQAIADYFDEQEGQLEKSLVALQDLLAFQKMQSIESTTREIVDLKDRLKELLEQLRDAPNEELKKAIAKEMGRLRQRMAELLERMKGQLEDLPQEHVNAESLLDHQMSSKSQHLLNNLSSLEEMLERGEIDEALRMLEEMSTRLDEMGQQMTKQFGKAVPERLRALDAEVSKLVDSVTDLQMRQRSLESETRGLEGRNREQSHRRLEEMAKRASGALREEIARSASELDKVNDPGLSSQDRVYAERLAEQLNQLDEMLEKTDIQEGQAAAKKTLEEAKNLEFGLELGMKYMSKDSASYQEAQQKLEATRKIANRQDAIARRLDELMEEGRLPVPGESGQEAMALSEEQSDIQAQAESVQESIRQSVERFPVLGDVAQKLERSGESMREASSSLKSESVQEAIDHERAALDALSDAQRSMQELLSKERKVNSRSPSREKVAIPRESSRNAHRAYRRSIVEAMKDGQIEGYAEEIDDYYESLIE